MLATAEPIGGCGCAAPDTSAADRCYCSVDDLVHVIGRKHALAIVNRIGEGGARFTELQRALDVSSSVLSETLEDLARVGLVRRTVLEERPPATEYTLTSAGATLRERLRPLLDRVRKMEGS